MTLPDHLRKYVEDEAAKHLNSQMSNVKNECMREALKIDFIAGAEAMYQKYEKLKKATDSLREAMECVRYRYEGNLKGIENCANIALAEYKAAISQIEGDGHE